MKTVTFIEGKVMEGSDSDEIIHFMPSGHSFPLWFRHHSSVGVYHKSTHSVSNNTSYVWHKTQEFSQDASNSD